MSHHITITDELREWAEEFWEFAYSKFGDKSKLLAIADRIDAEHEAMLEDARKYVYEGYVELPVDADGEYIHVGDVMAYADNTKPMEVVALVPPAVFLTEDGPRYADMCRHYHDPTVEDVLREFGIDWEHESDCEDRAALLKEYAAKLRLAGDAE